MKDTFSSCQNNLNPVMPLRGMKGLFTYFFATNL